jgi:hypothetical protein
VISANPMGARPQEAEGKICIFISLVRRTQFSVETLYSSFEYVRYEETDLAFDTSICIRESFTLISCGTTVVKLGNLLLIFLV